MFNFVFKKKEGTEKFKFKKIPLVILVLLLMLFSFAAGMYITGSNKILSDLSVKESVYLGKVTNKYQQAGGEKISKDVDFNLYWQLWDELQSKYVDKDKLNEKKMFYGSLAGLAASLGDPYTIFMDPAQSKEFNDDLSGTFEGIGAELGLKNDTLVIIAPLDGMPAQKAGIMAGDIIVDINGTSTVGMSTNEAVTKIRGPKGTKVKLTIYRPSFKAPKDFEIERATIYVKSVKTETTKDGFFVIKVSSFNEDTLDLFNQATKEALAKNPKGLIIDLRNNPGGFLDTAVSMIGKWVHNDTAVIEKYSDGTENKYATSGASPLTPYKTVVLVNGGSASASEILAGALQDYGLAKIIGEQTYGKGSVQTLDPLSDGSSIKITIAKWLTPKGNSINEHGVTPDIEVKLTEDDFNNNKDPQMDKAIEVLLNKK